MFKDCLGCVNDRVLLPKAFSYSKHQGMFVSRAMYWGHASARDNFALQLGTIAREAYQSLGETPVLIGECGVPMDMKSVSISTPASHLVFGIIRC
jgi:hypothetical protein